jgi:predicted nucleotidyltransferase
MERVLNQLVERLRKTYDDRLVSVVLYGSAAVGDHHGRFSDLNILCVLRLVTSREPDRPDLPLVARTREPVAAPDES